MSKSPAQEEVKSVVFKYNVKNGSGASYTVYESHESGDQQEINKLLEEVKSDPNKTLIDNDSIQFEDRLIADHVNYIALQPLPNPPIQQLVLPAANVEVEPSDVQLLLSIKEEVVAPEVAAVVVAKLEKEPAANNNNEEEEEYNSDGTYKHNGHKESYTPFGSNIGEGDKVLTLFATVEFGVLKRNFAFCNNNADPLFPDTRRINLNDLYDGDGPIRKMRVNPEFWKFVIEEYTLHQRIRTVRTEERTNGWNKGGCKRWRDEDFFSLLVNKQRLPPKPDTSYKPALGN